MNGTVAKDKVTIRGIANESQFEIVADYVRKSGCLVQFKDHTTIAFITGTPTQLAKFVKLWNKD